MDIELFGISYFIPYVVRDGESGTYRLSDARLSVATYEALTRAETSPDELGARIIWNDRWHHAVIMARDNVSWPAWWFLYRLNESIEIFIRFFIAMLEIWGLAHTPPGERRTWRNSNIIRRLFGDSANLQEG